jgi:hypothetical protein
MKYHDNTSFASDSIGIDIDLKKLKFLIPEIFSPIQEIKYKFKKWGFSTHIEVISEHVKYGDSQGAIVVKTNPLLIAAYNEDIDCIVMLVFEDKIQNKYNFKIQDRLVCVNTFAEISQLQSDLIPGKNNSGMWTLVHPIIADLVSSDAAKIEKRKNEIGDKGYEYIWQLATDYLKLKKGVSRIGKPIYSDQVIPQYF